MSDSTSPPGPSRAADEDTAARRRAEERARGMRVIRDVVPYIWPAGRGPAERRLKARVVIALGLLVLAKLVAEGTPLLYSRAVCALAGARPGLQGSGVNGGRYRASRSGRR